MGEGKRDFFVHRLFKDGVWPGDLDDDEFPSRYRKLLYLEIIFGRAAHRIWHIFAHADLMAITDLGPNGLLTMNPDLFGDAESGSASP